MIGVRGGLNKLKALMALCFSMSNIFGVFQRTGPDPFNESRFYTLFVVEAVWTRFPFLEVWFESNDFE